LHGERAFDQHRVGPLGRKIGPDEAARVFALSGQERFENWKIGKDEVEASGLHRYSSTEPPR